MDHDIPPLEDVLGKLPWFAELTARHQHDLIDEVARHLSQETTRDDYASLLERWCGIAHGDVKWSRFDLLRESGLLAS